MELGIIDQPLYVLGILCLLILISEYLVRHTFCKHLGTALLVILLGAITANLGLIPSASNAIPLYHGIFKYLAPLSLFFLLLEVNLVALKKAGLPMLIMFLLGTFGTVLGVWVSMTFLLPPETFGEWRAIMGGMFTATYTGGGLNFNTLALHYRIMEEGVIYAGAAAVDNIITTVWMLICLGLPIVLNRLWPRKAVEKDNNHPEPSFSSDTLNMYHLGILILLGVFTLFVSDRLTQWFQSMDVIIPSILVVTTIALILAQLPQIRSIKGSTVLGMFGIYLFLVVIGAFCELSALKSIGALAGQLLYFTMGLVLIHGLVVFGIGSLTPYDWQVISVASQANIGGSTSALALAESFGRDNLVLPAVLVGALGNALGSYLGFLMVEFL
jgi:uncharacterized membrane protein